jgi:hypothetical protein
MVGEEQDGTQMSNICSRGKPLYDLSVALNHGFAAGSPQFLQFVTKCNIIIHDLLYYN